MEYTEIIRITIYILAVALGGLAVWYKGNAKISGMAARLIAQAEYEYKDLAKSGGVKNAWVIDQLYGLIPAPVRVFVPRSLVATLVQTTFDAMTGFAKLQLDQLAETLAADAATEMLKAGGEADMEG